MARIAIYTKQSCAVENSRLPSVFTAPMFRSSSRNTANTAARGR